VARDDPKSLADRIIWLFEHPERMRSMGAVARHRYERLYTEQCFIERMRGIFACVANGVV
jgi:glycosyltransferase involved in cell wall biosynthesis